MQAFANSEGWDKEEYYKTLKARIAHINQKPRLIISGLNQQSIVTHYYDFTTKAWQALPVNTLNNKVMCQQFSGQVITQLILKFQTPQATSNHSLNGV